MSSEGRSILRPPPKLVQTSFPDLNGSTSPSVTLSPKLGVLLVCKIQLWRGFPYKLVHMYMCRTVSYFIIEQVRNTDLVVGSWTLEQVEITQ